MLTKVWFWIAVAVALGVFVRLKKGATDSAPAQDKAEPDHEPRSEEVTQPIQAANASSENPTLVMSPEEAQQVALEAMNSRPPSEVPSETAQEETLSEPATETPAEPEPVAEAEPDAPSLSEPEPKGQQDAAAPQAAPAGGNAVLVLLDVSGNQLSSPNRATLAAAQQLATVRNADLHICCLGADTSAAATALCEGAATVHTITDPSLGDGVSEGFTAAAMVALEALPADVVMGPASTAGKGFLPRMAERLGCGMVTEILSVESADTFTRALWAGSAIATVQGTGRLVVSVRATGFDPARTSSCNPQAIAFTPAATRARFVGRETTESARPDLSEATVVVSGGRGTKGDFAPIEHLADALSAAMGASRAACDAGWVPNDLQVGQTGKVVAPNLYIAVGISGAIQHIAGMKGSKTIVAINKDEEAPIFQVADYGLVADLFDACPELADKVASQGLKATS